jgi:hypothetical protein
MLRDTRTQVARWACHGWFPTFWSFIGIVSALDIYLIDRFRGVLAELEENPVGQFLIELDGGDVGVFIRAKAFGTVFVLSVLAGLYVYRRRWSFPVTASVAAFQFGLLAYLVLGKPLLTTTEFTGNPRVDVANCVEAFRDGISSVLPHREMNLLSIPTASWQSQASLTDNAALAPR